MNNLSLRATGLLTILQHNPDMMLDVESLHTHFSESQQYVEHTLKELSESGRIEMTNDCIRILDPLELNIANRTLKERISALFRENRTFHVIAWFLSQIDKTFELDSELHERVMMEYDSASVVQFWSDYHIAQAMKRALVDKSLGNVTMTDLLELLRRRDKGEIVWQK